MALRDDLLALAPEIADNSRVDLFLGYASLRVSRSAWGTKADMATVFLAAHMLTRFSTDMVASVPGQTIENKIGDIQESYGKLDMKGDEELATTTYGANYAQMRKSLRLTPLVV